MTSCRRCPIVLGAAAVLFLWPLVAAAQEVETADSPDSKAAIKHLQILIHSIMQIFFRVHLLKLNYLIIALIILVWEVELCASYSYGKSMLMT